MEKWQIVFLAFITGAIFAPLIVYLTAAGGNSLTPSEVVWILGGTPVLAAVSLGGGFAGALYISSLDIR